MAGGVSRHYEAAWVFNPEGNEHKDRVGRILAQGNDLKGTLREQALSTAKRSVAFENEQTGKPHMLVGEHASQDGTKASALQAEFAQRAEKPEVDARGYTWVTADGKTIGPASETSHFEPLPPATPKQTLTTDRQRAMATLPPSERSMYMWRRVNPGCVEQTTKLPPSTYKAHFVDRPEDVQPQSKEFHMKKSEFTSFADQMLKSGGVKKR